MRGVRGQGSPEKGPQDCAAQAGEDRTHPGGDGWVTALTNLETTHVVDLGAESQRGQNVDH